ncbi:MAG: riboflavin synthase [Alphaproteobacteria bacterium]|nr:riboflavin synthase [Alphaproteobacteria bacterium]
MFTGLIQDIGEVTAIDKQGDWTLTIKPQKLPLERMVIGASVACNGICLTLTEKNAKQFKVQVSRETLSKTTAVHWREGQKINLEPALRIGDELGGHILSGHVDGVARIANRSENSDSVIYKIDIPESFAKFIAAKGSISIDGVSLTVNEAENSRFSVNIIPHTRQMTTLDALKQGDEVNFEVDMIARYVERMMTQRTGS